LLFDRLGAAPGKSVDPRTLLITGGAGGVGSILIQLARRLTGLTVVATASRPDSQKWCLDLGTHAVIDHSKPMKEQIKKLKLPPVGLIASLTNTDQHYKALADIIAPQGKYGLIDDPPEFNVSVFKGKAVSIHWESMFTRSSFQTPDMIGQHHLLNDVADLIDKGVLRTTLDQTFWDHQRRQFEARPMRCWNPANRAARSCWRGGRHPLRRVGKGALRARAHHLTGTDSEWWARFAFAYPTISAWRARPSNILTQWSG